MSERRREPRHPAQVPVVVSVGKKAVPTETFDVSYRGLYIHIGDLPPLRQLIKVEIQLPAETFSTHAMVVRHGERDGGQGIGVEFFGRVASDAWDKFVAQQRTSRLPSEPSPGPHATPLPPMNPQPFGGPGYAQGSHQSSPTHQAQPAQHQSSPTHQAQPAQHQSSPTHQAQPQHGSAPPGVERRKHPRFSLPIEIRVRTQRSMHVTWGIDGSNGGVSLCGQDLALHIGEQVVLNLSQPGTPFSFRVDAAVKRTVPSPQPGTYAFGLEFMLPDESRAAALYEFIATARDTIARQMGL